MLSIYGHANGAESMEPIVFISVKHVEFIEVVFKVDPHNSMHKEWHARILKGKLISRKRFTFCGVTYPGVDTKRETGFRWTASDLDRISLT